MLELKSVSFSYGRHQALKQLNLSIPKGKIYGFVGPNGAGKTTTMKLIAGLLRPQSGEIWLDGHLLNGQPELTRKAIGYMPDFFGVYDNLLVREYLQFFGELFELSAAQIEERTQTLLQLVDLLEVIDKPVDTLSRGMKQRLCLARALIHEPALLLLDEPASGMDPVARIQMKAILKTLSDRGQTILISSHILPELSEICDEIGVIHKGQMITMTGRDEGDYMVVKVKTWEESGEAEGLAQCLEALKNSQAIRSYELESQTEAQIALDGGMAVVSKLSRTLNASLNIIHFEIVTESLEDQFKRLILNESPATGGEGHA